MNLLFPDDQPPLDAARGGGIARPLHPQYRFVPADNGLKIT